jgi:hypothetical protein
MRYNCYWNYQVRRVAISPKSCSREAVRARHTRAKTSVAWIVDVEPTAHPDHPRHQALALGFALIGQYP